MKTIHTSLNTISKIESFLSVIRKYDYNFDLIQGQLAVDAKSTMGIFCLNLEEPISLNIYADDAEDISGLLEELKPYTIPESL